MKRHEASDVDTNAIFGIGASLAGVTAVVLLVVWLLFRYVDYRQTEAAAPMYPLMAGQEQRLPPEPRLQTAPAEDLRVLRAREDEVLNSYQWVDKSAGLVRIPIAEAMKLTLQRGLPARPAGGGQPR